ncbi:MAG TPA: RNA polymerase sigma factor [Solirubrobacteraceae bacterium]
MSAVIDSTVVGAKALGYSSDEHLISRLRAHDDDAFATLVARYEHQLLGFCRRMLGSREDAEDVLQDTFAAAYKAILADERVIECRPWLYQIARNRCLNAIRGRRPTHTLGMDGIDSDGIEPRAALGTAEQVARRLEIKLLVNDILALPEQQRQALVLHELEGCSYEQISHTLGASVASVRSLLLRARRTLLALAEGRALPCVEARAQLDEPGSPTPVVRRHLELCSDCAGYKKQQRRRSIRVLRAISPLGLLLPLKSLVPARILRRVAPHAAAGGSGAAGATAGAGSAATAGAGLSAVAAKALAGLAVLAAAGTGTVVVQQATSGGQHPARHPAAVKAPVVVPVQSAVPVLPPAPPVSPPSVHRSKAPKTAPPPTPSSTSPSSSGRGGQPGTPSDQGSHGSTGVPTTSSPATAGRTRPLPGSGMSPARTRPVPYQAPNSGRAWPQGSSTGTSGQGSSTGTSNGSSSGSSSSQGSSGSSSLSSATGTGSADTSVSSSQPSTDGSGSTPGTGSGTTTTGNDQTTS